jgi:hypothetical protein
MPAITPFDILADELGAVAGRVEREASLRLTATLADLDKRDAERELRLVRLEQTAAERLAALRDGKDGAPGKDGRDGENGADGAPGRDGVDADPEAIAAHLVPEVERAVAEAVQREMPSLVAPDFVTERLERAFGLLEQPLAATDAPVVVNVASAPSRRVHKTITMRRDADGNAVADVIERGD